MADNGKKAYARSCLSAAALLLLLGSCITAAPGTAVTGAAAPEETRETTARLVETAYGLLGRERLSVDGRQFRLDCTGVVQAVYWGAGIDLEKPLAQYRGNGVARLYGYLDDRGLVEEGIEPVPGDIIFWDDTYDYNENGKADDPLTHVGMVVSVERNGDLEYIHHNYRKGIILERMNPRTPGLYSRVEGGKTVVVNSPMRMRGSPEYDRTLSGELVRAWGRAWLLAAR